MALSSTSALARSAARRLARLVPLAAEPARALSSTAGTVVEVGSVDAWEAATKGAGLAVTDFTAKWCGPCKAVAPVYEALAKEHPDVAFLKVDIDDEELASVVETARISAVPTFQFHRAGEQLGEVRGADVAALAAFVEKHK